MQNSSTKEEGRFFIAFEVISPWPENEPKGRYIEKPLRHLTLAFLGETARSDIIKLISKMPLPSFTVGPVGIFDKILALPFRKPNVIAYRAEWLKDENLIEDFRLKLKRLLQKNSFHIKSRENFLSHVSVARSPFIIKEWKKNFSKLPLFVSSLVLYESLGSSKYLPIWKHDFILPFIELEHTADIAFKIRGDDFNSLYINAFIALCFKFPEMSEFFVKQECETLDDVIIHLNEIISRLDIEIGSPIKAVSYQSNIKNEKNYMEWEMIADV